MLTIMDMMRMNNGLLFTEDKDKTEGQFGMEVILIPNMEESITLPYYRSV